MPQQHPHLDLPFFKTYPRKKQRGGGYGPKRSLEEREEMAKIQEEQFVNLKSSFQKDKSRYKIYFDPNFIFKLEITQAHEETIRSKLQSMEIEILSPSPDKTGFWIALAENEDGTEFLSKLNEYGTGTKILTCLIN